MNIGSIKVRPAVALAPMAGITDHSFRLLSKEQGCGLVYSEMISSRGLVQDRGCGYRSLVYYTDRERPIAFQLFGSEPEIMAAAARKLERMGADIIDLNFSCPAPKVVGRGQGGALMKDLRLCGKIMQAVVSAISCPVTIKIRKGWDDRSVNAPALAMLAAENGIKAVAVHGRTVLQGFSGPVDWDIIREVKRIVPGVTVIGSGDIRQPADVDLRLQQSGCDGVMIGRAALGNPWIFKQIKAWQERGELIPGPSCGQVKEMVIRHLDLLCRVKGERAAVLEMRSQAAYYIKGRRGASRVRRQLNKATSRLQVAAIITDFYPGAIAAPVLPGRWAKCASPACF
ncbi:MAG TPA: tRNA dihydrouridine synthase DusB [Firmicutes bacterium]|nr:tRNA dihydrouridine synthase DusB [Bacillota bacterium]